MNKLTMGQIVNMHRLIIQETGGSEGIKDEGLLESALSVPFQTFDGEDLYKTIRAKAAKLSFLLINNHSFIDGNKRIGTLAMLVFLEINGIEIKCTDDELINLGIGIVSVEGTFRLSSFENKIVPYKKNQGVVSGSVVLFHGSQRAR